MPSLSLVLKSEIVRVARKTLKAEVDALRRASARHRKEISALKKTLSGLQRRHAELEKGVKKRADDADSVRSESHSRTVRFSAAGLKELRSKLGLSAAQLARLIGTSGQSIYNWEQGKNTPRLAEAQKLAALRSVGKREAQARLHELAGE